MASAMPGLFLPHTNRREAVVRSSVRIEAACICLALRSLNRKIVRVSGTFSVTKLRAAALCKAIQVVSNPTRNLRPPPVKTWINA